MGASVGVEVAVKVGVATGLTGVGIGLTVLVVVGSGVSVASNVGDGGGSVGVGKSGGFATHRENTRTVPRTRTVTMICNALSLNHANSLCAFVSVIIVLLPYGID